MSSAVVSRRLITSILLQILDLPSCERDPPAHPMPSPSHLPRTPLLPHFEVWNCQRIIFHHVVDGLQPYHNSFHNCSI